MDNYKNFKPEDINFYDMLEVAALRRQYVIIYYQEGNKHLSLKAFIDDLDAEEGLEQLHLHNGQTLRLEQIISVDGNFDPSTDMDIVSCLCH